MDFLTMTTVFTDTMVATPASDVVVTGMTAIVLLTLVVLLASKEVLNGATVPRFAALDRSLGVGAMPLIALFAVVFMAYAVAAID
jgi:hypothetical protein